MEPFGRVPLMETHPLEREFILHDTDESPVGSFRAYLGEEPPKVILHRDVVYTLNQDNKYVKADYYIHIGAFSSAG